MVMSSIQPSSPFYKTCIKNFKEKKDKFSMKIIHINTFPNVFTNSLVYKYRIWYFELLKTNLCLR